MGVATISVKYEHDLKNITYDLVISEMFLTEKIVTAALVSASPGHGEE